MSAELAAKLDFGLAWRRMLLDRPNRCFATHPFHLSWVETDLDGWIEQVRGQVVNGYAPCCISLCESPKGNWMVRPGASLALEDELLYTALVGLMLPAIRGLIGWCQGDPDIAYQLESDHAKPEWVKTGFIVWKEWREKSLAQLEQGPQFMVATDLAAFYENIDIARLSSDLKGAGADVEAVDCLLRCVRKWAEPRGKGIPQGYTASDILAKLYLAAVDLGLKDAGFRHLRYVDDIRIFCSNSLECRKAILELNRLVRNRGLNLQAAKTHILRLDEARSDIDGVAPTIGAIDKELRRELADIFGLTYSGATLDQIEEAVCGTPDAPALPVLERAFADYFIEQGQEFDKTLFHYLLTRLGRTRSAIAVSYCVSILPLRPEETGPVLRYLAQVGVEDITIAKIIEYIGSEEAIYDFQMFEILRWFFKMELCPDALRNVCRYIAWDRNRLSSLRAYAIALLGSHGSVADLERIESEYQRAATDIERAEIVQCMARVEPARRNAFLGRVSKDGYFVQLAVKLVKAGAGV